MNALTTARQRLDACAPAECPICGRDFEGSVELDDDYIGSPFPESADDIHRAAHCCLWKTHDHAARVRIAEHVETGATWAEAIEGETHAR